MGKRPRVCAQLVLVLLCAAPRLAPGQTLDDSPLIPIPSDTADSAVTSTATDQHSAVDHPPHDVAEHDATPAVGCPDCGHWHGWGRRCGVFGGQLFHRVPSAQDSLFRRPSHNGRDVGLGQPLRGTSWLNRPQYVGWFFGILAGDNLINQRVDQNTDLFGGYRFGWDMDHFWATEFRLGWAALNLSDNQVPPRNRTSNLIVGDVSFLYYPWGDARWRPYVSMGLGASSFDFVDDVGIKHDDTLFALPIGFGIKYLTERRWLALRADVTDNIAFSDAGLDSMHNVGITFGVEIHYGVQPKTYWPWHPSRHMW